MADATITQRCTLCNLIMPIDAFYLRSPGVRRRGCIQCHSLRTKARYLETREACIKRAGDYKKKNAQKTLEANRKWRSENRSRDGEVKAEWRKRNPHMVVAATQRRNASKLLATVKWSNESEIFKIYAIARAKTLETGIKWHVDHIVPLRSNIVCGLHVEQNLRVITATDNTRKSNTWWPDMP